MPRTDTVGRRRQARRDLDALTGELRPLLPVIVRPRSGWVESVRQALGMSRKDMAERMGVAESTVARLESSERADTVQLDTLRRAAAALECDLVYALVPRRPLEEMALEQARKQVASLVGAAAHTMLLEDQMPNDKAVQQLIDDTARDRMDRPGLWNDAR